MFVAVDYYQQFDHMVEHFDKDLCMKILDLYSRV
jgi:hypothetical protein